MLDLMFWGLSTICWKNDLMALEKGFWLLVRFLTMNLDLPTLTASSLRSMNLLTMAVLMFSPSFMSCTTS